MRRVILTVERWRQVDRPRVTIFGLEPCLALFGVA